MKGQTLSEWERGLRDERTEFEGLGAGVWGQSPHLGDERTDFERMGAGVWGQSPQLGDESLAFRLGEVKFG
jgi:hypothetical protein